jgi:hypothetical protein
VESVALNSHGEDPLDYEVRLRVLACEGVRGENGSGYIRFSMTWETQSVGTNSTLIKSGTFVANPGVWDGKDYGKLALGLSDVIARAGKMLAADLPMQTLSPDKSSREATKP